MTAAQGAKGYTHPGEEDWIVHPEWCGWDTWALSYLCETYLDAPIWNTVLIGDAVALWMILAIVHRERELKQKAELERASVPKAVRSRRSWQKLATTVRLATLRGSKGSQDSSWSFAWQQVARQRVDRKDYLRRREFEIATVIMRAAGPLILGSMWLLIAFEAHAFFTIGLPWLNLGPRAHTVTFGLCAMYALRIFMNYALVALTDPGRPPKNGSAVELAVADVELASSSSQARHCGPCGAAKPPRCHHCRVCRRCVLKMDHHCPFVNNCIGLHNYRHFCNFLFDLVMGSFLVIAALAGPTFSVLRRHVDGMTFPHQVHILVAFVVCLLAECSLGPFLLFHLSLILVNETTLETMGRRFARGNAAKKMVSYDRGTVANFEEVCGPLPPWVRRMPDLLTWRHAKRCE